MGQTLQSFGWQGSGGGSGGGGNVPSGGEEGQYLQKASATDFDTQWNWVQKTFLLVENGAGVTLPAGSPVVPTGVSGSRIVVRLAVASSASLMPAIGVLTEELADGEQGFAISQGVFNKTISGLTGVSVGQKIFVSATGTLTNVKPTTSSNLIQNIGVVLQTNGSNIQKMKVSAIDRTNDVPNLTDGNFFIGSSTYTQTSAYKLPTSAPSNGQFLQYNSANTAFEGVSIVQKVSYLMGGTASGWAAREKLILNRNPIGGTLSSTIASPVISTPKDLLAHPITNIDAGLKTTISVSGFAIVEGLIGSPNSYRIDIGLATISNGDTSATFTMTNGSTTHNVSTTSGAMNIGSEEISFTSASNQLIIVSCTNPSASSSITSGAVSINMRVDIIQELDITT